MAMASEGDGGGDDGDAARIVDQVCKRDGCDRGDGRAAGDWLVLILMSGGMAHALWWISVFWCVHSVPNGHCAPTDC